jgi:hypothetical protein
MSKVSYNGYLGHGASVFVGLQVNSNIDNLKVGEIKPTTAFVRLSSDINPNGVSKEIGIARSYVIEFRVEGSVRKRGGRTEEKPFFYAYQYGITIDEVMNKFEDKVLYDLFPLEFKNGLKLAMSKVYANGGGVGSMNRYDAVVYFVTNDDDQMEKEYLGIEASSKDNAENMAIEMFYSRDADRYNASDINYVSVWDRGTAYANGGGVKSRYVIVLKNEDGSELIQYTDAYNLMDATKQAKLVSDVLKKRVINVYLVDEEVDIEKYRSQAKRMMKRMGKFAEGGGVKGIGEIEKFFEDDDKKSVNAKSGELVYVNKLYSKGKLFLQRMLSKEKVLISIERSIEKRNPIIKIIPQGDVYNTKEFNGDILEITYEGSSIRDTYEKVSIFANGGGVSSYGKGGGVFGEDAKLEYVDDAFASDELKDELREKLGIKGNSLGDNVVISFAYTDYGGDFLDKVAIAYFKENYPDNIISEYAGYNGENAYVFGEPAQEWIDTTDDYPLGFEDIEDMYYQLRTEAEFEDFDYFLDDLKRDEYVFDKDEVMQWLLENKDGYYSITTQGIDFSSSDLTDELLEEGLISKEDEDEDEDEYGHGGGIKDVIVYDNNGETFDRYTIFTPDGSVYGMSDNALMPNGFNMYIGDNTEVEKGSHLGKKLKSVPESIKIAVQRRMSEEYARGGKLWIDTKTKGGLKGVKPSRKNTFAKQAQKRGLTSGQLASKVLANPSRYQGINPKSAQLVKNMGVRKQGGSIGDIIRSRRGQ